MADLVLIIFLLILVSLNIAFFRLAKKDKLSLVVSGLLLVALASVVNFSISASLLQFVDWSPEDTREGAGYGGAILALVTFGNGVVLLAIGLIGWIFTSIKKE